MRDEFDVMRAIDQALAELPDEASRKRVLQWVLMTHRAEPLPGLEEERAPESSAPADRRRGGGKRRASVASPTVSVIKDLNLRPAGKQSFREFAESKKPANHKERGVVAVYYLTRTLELTNVSVDHVHTCFKDANWRVPANLRNMLAQAASVNGWLDTSSSSDIRITTIGENLVEHDLPAASS